MKKKGYKVGILTLSALLAGVLLLPVQGAVYAEQGATTQQASPLFSNKGLGSVQLDTRANIKNLIDQAANREDVPGVIAGITKNGQKWSYASGEASVYDTRSVQTDFHFRIGSTTKTFVATVVLQLVGENKLSLDDSVEKWLPGVVQGNGYDGSKITIRQLLNHTSGIANYTSEAFVIDFVQTPYRTFTEKELLDIALAKQPSFTPGTKWEYSNTNTVLAGLVIQKVTGEPFGEQIKKRIIDPLQMKGTFVPGSASHIQWPHARGYLLHEGKFIDMTELNPSWGDAAGEMISTVDDLNTFFSALLGGKLLKPEQLQQMLTGVPTDLGIYGLGIYETKLSNGVSFWGHGGNIHGFSTMAGGILGGEHVMALSTNVLANDSQDGLHHLNIIEAEFGGAGSK